MRNGFLIGLLFLLMLPVSAQDVPDCTVPLEIWQVQGSSDQSNCDGERVRLEHNIVTAVGKGGFFIQTPPERSDNDPLTSDGIYVYTTVPGAAFGVQPGDLVHVEGRVDEYYQLTELVVSGRQRVEIIQSGLELPPVVDLFTVDLTWTVGVDVHPLERYEGMRVAVANALVVAPTNYFDEFGISLTGERVFREMGIEIDQTPEFAGLGLPLFDLNPELLEVDPPEMALAVEFVTVNSRVTVNGVLSYSYLDYQIWPVDLQIELAEFAPRPVRPRAEGEFTIATQNVLNMFDRIDDPQRNDTSGEDFVPATAEIYQIRLRKMSAQIRLNLGAPDILAVQEMENIRVLTALAQQIHADDPALTYATCLQEGADDRGIDNGFLWRTDRVNMQSCYQMPGSTTARASLGGGLLFDRPPLVMEVQLLNGRQFLPMTVIGLHNKSLSGADTATTQAERLDQAMFIAQYVQSLLDADPDAHIVVLGDLNTFEVSDGLVDGAGIIAGTQDPSQALVAPEGDSLQPDLINQVLRVPREDRYSFIYNSTSQVLDHIMTSPALDACVTDAQFSRGNADALYPWETEDNGPLRSSDHDGFVVYLNPACE